MISGLSKAITLYLAPLLALTAILLTTFAFLSPVVMLHGQVALLTVTPSTSLIPTNSSSSQSVDGPSVFLGLLGSCSRTSNSAKVYCSSPSLSPTYNLTALPTKAPSLLLNAPTASTPAFIAVALGFSVLFFVMFTLSSFRHLMGDKASAALDKPMIQRLSAWIGFFGFLIGITSFLIIRMWFGEAVQDFNSSIEAQAAEGAALVAATGNAFTMAWVAYAFYSVPVIISLAKLNVKASK